jgi:dTMP kinase
VILIDCEPSIGLRRKQNKDRLELEDLAFHQRVRQEYLNLAAQEPVPFLIINTDEGLWEEYQKIVEKAVCKVFNV